MQPLTPLRLARLRAQLSQTDLSAEIGVSQSYIRDMEVGARRPNPKHSTVPQRLSDALGVPVDELFPPVQP